MRALAGLQGAVLGGLVALLAAAAAVAWARWTGGAVPGTVLAAVGVGLMTATSLAFAARPIALPRCARALDRTLDGHDRVLSALAFGSATESTFTRAVIADAVRRGRQVTPARVAPLRRPRGLFALAAAALSLLAAGVFPVPSRAGSVVATAGIGKRPEPPLRLDPATLAAEREEARLAEKAAALSKDDELRELARALGAAVRALGEGQMPRGEALDHLAELQKRADELAGESEELKQGLERSAATMKEAPVTKALGEALSEKEPGATEKALAQLAERAAQAPGAERRSLSDTLAQAAGEAMGNAAAGPPGRGAETDNSEPDPQRRLARERPAKSAGDSQQGAGGRAGERRLQRLRRELDEMAAACREDPERCRRRLQEGARELPRMETEARNSEARRRLSTAVRQLRERLRRDAAGERNSRRQREEKQFTRAARGKAAPGGSRGESEGKGKGTTGDEAAMAVEESGADDLELESSGEGETGEEGSAASAEGAAMTAEGAAPGGGQGDKTQNNEGGKAGAANGQGIGNQAGADPLGRRDGQETRGREREAAVRSGAGPTRAQVIEAAAARGFTRGGYRDVFQDYQAVVEESLDASDVPPGRRYVVRRYFQLIRPRAAPAAAPAKPRSP